MDLGLFLKKKRKEKKLTLKQVAEGVGVSEATVSRWESNDIKHMKVDKITALSKMLDISELDFFNGWDENGVALEKEQISIDELQYQIKLLLNKNYDLTYQDKQMILNSLEYVCDKHKSKQL